MTRFCLLYIIVWVNWLVIGIGSRFWFCPQIGRWTGGGTQNFNGNIASALIYDRALTATEISQNYNAQKGRYGL